MNPFQEHEREHLIQEDAALMEDLNAMPSPDLSAAYLQKKHAFLHRHKKSRRQKMAAALISIIISLIFAACIAPIRNLVIQVYETFTSYLSISQGYFIADLNIQFAYFPDGYQLTEENAQDMIYQATYRSAGNPKDSIHILIASAGEKKNYIDHEQGTEQVIAIGDKECRIVRHRGTGQAILYCSTPIASIEIFSSLPDDELLHMMKEMRITTKEKEPIQ